MNIKRISSQPSIKGPSDWFAGEEIHAGDVAWFPPREKHWHGATSRADQYCK